MAAEAQAFLDGLEDSVNASARRVDLYRLYHKDFAVNNLTKLFADGPSKLYLHADDTEIILHKAVRRNRRLASVPTSTARAPAPPPPAAACTNEASASSFADKASTCAAL
ncbi:unnamed protein product [Symbiodinium natans]|uniref:Uncharacterized protein n=1 Tax=Symbiodinium natans TaxID=878477 RepID=A0A812SPG5_9DINO|nr:unnamed protein product [Symbiodinium natans]